MKVDLSIGQRLTIGFALLLLLLSAAFFGVSRSVDASARAQATFRQNIVPLRQHAAELERAVYRLAIATRAFFIVPNDGNADSQRVAAASVSVANRSLRNAAKDEIGDALYRKLDLLVEEYLSTAGGAVQERHHRPLGLRTELELREAHDKAISSINSFSQYQESRARTALAEIARKRDSVTDDLRLAFILAVVLFVGIAFLTVQAIRRPTRELVELAGGFERGMWRSALGLMPPTGQQPSNAVRDEMTQLRRAFGAAAAALERREQRLHADAQVAAAAVSSLDKGELADSALIAIAEHVRADAAVLYLLNDDVLEVIATYATEPLPAVRVGEGLPGQAAKSRRALFTHSVAEAPPLKVYLGFAAWPPKTVGAVPLCFGDDVLGVLLIGCAGDIDESDRAFLRAASAQVAVGLRNALTHEELQRVLRGRAQHRAGAATAEVTLDLGRGSDASCAGGATSDATFFETAARD